MQPEVEGISVTRPVTNATSGRVRGAALLMADMLALFAGWMLAVSAAHVLGRAGPSSWLPPATPGGVVYSLMCLLALVFLAINGQYGRRAAFWEEIRIAWRTIGLMALGNFALNFFAQIGSVRLVPLMAWALVALLLPVGRLAMREALIRAGLWRRKALVVGEGPNARAVCQALQQERNMGMEIVGVASFDGARMTLDDPDTDETGGIPAYFLDQDVEGLARELGCEAIVVALDENGRGRVAQLVSALHAQRFEVFVVPELGGLPVHGLQAQHFFSNDMLFLRLRHSLLSPFSGRLKRFLDVVIAGSMMLALVPLMAWVAWRIWREDGAPVLYTQCRVGLNGESFRLFKFRSMLRNADALLQEWQESNLELYRQYQINTKLVNDPRILKMGGWLRRSSIDELPQLWNVLRGDMSMVGPRPVQRFELSKYSPDVRELYLQVRPGITGLWQVSGRSDTSFDDRAAYDSWYVRNWSLWIDVVILLKTVRVVLSGRGAV